MNILMQIVVVFAVCLLGEFVTYLLPFAFPSSVVSMVLLLIFMLTGVIKQKHINDVSNFLLSNIAVLFIPSAVTILRYKDVFLANAFPIVVVCLVSTPIVYLATAWSIQATMRLMKKYEEKKHA